VFLSLDQIVQSLKNLESIHPFYGITFLVCKTADLPVGKSISFAISDQETEFLDNYYKPDERSEYFYRVFRPSDKQKHWIDRKKYASSTLQSIRTQTVFTRAFFHDPNTDLWGWRDDYIAVLEDNLSRNLAPFRGERIPAFYLAVWLYRDRDWPSDTKEKDIIGTFLREFSITPSEEQELFDVSVPRDLFNLPLFQEHATTWDELRKIIGSPPDAKPEEGGTLSLLECFGIGPTNKLRFEPAQRLSLITGDNGLGKTFLLECAWWALTGNWAGLEAYPRQDTTEAKITFQISSEQSKPETRTITYDWKNQVWPSPKKRPTIPGLIVYARVDGSFAVWDPARAIQSSERANSHSSRSLTFTRDQVWEGQRGKIEGLLLDWVKWQSTPERHPFEIFKAVLSQLSPPDLGRLEPGEPRRLPNDPREIPTLKHIYGEVPIVYASAGVRRIVTLAYLIVWAWNEHRIAAEMAHTSPQQRMVVLIDEMEAHLHPQWQRAVLPALLDVRELLTKNLRAQFLVATHSPLVMASIESQFKDEVDKLFHLDLEPNGQVSLKELQFVRYGAIDSWLTSEVFELRHARSLEAERLIEKAKALQKQEHPKVEDVQRVSQELMKTLASGDEFWPRWVYFAEQNGVYL
jgi:hypothetical protein